jgi:hypothetical protein
MHRSRSATLPGPLTDFPPRRPVPPGTPAHAFALRFETPEVAACNQTRLWLRGGIGADGRPCLDADITVINRCRHDPAQHFLLSAYFRATSFELDADPRLDTAILTGTLPVVACNGGLCAWVGESLSVALTLTGSAELARDPDAAISRQVVATGTVAGRWENFAPAPSVEGYLSRLAG